MISQALLYWQELGEYICILFIGQSFYHTLLQALPVQSFLSSEKDAKSKLKDACKKKHILTCVPYFTEFSQIDTVTKFKKLTYMLGVNVCCICVHSLSHA